VGMRITTHMALINVSSIILMGNVKILVLDLNLMMERLQSNACNGVKSPE